MSVVRVLATDLDGTLIPLSGSRENMRDLVLLTRELEVQGTMLVYVTGRDFSRVCHAIEEFELPLPHGVICDVGSTLITFEPGQSGRSCVRYEAFLASTVGDYQVDQLLFEFDQLNGLRRQEADRQGRFKLSFWCEEAECFGLEEEVRRLLRELAAPYEAIVSIDPLERRGLIDVLPQGVNKASALGWWINQQRLGPEAVVFAGDSGNDLAAFLAGYRAIIVANASQRLVETVRAAHRSAGWLGRLYVSQQTATTGVLEGYRHYLEQGSKWS